MSGLEDSRQFWIEKARKPLRVRIVGVRTKGVTSPSLASVSKSGTIWIGFRYEPTLNDSVVEIGCLSRAAA